jgi:putative FmdB family regulatory protein
MPIYVFRCDDCGEKFERLQKLSSADPDTCPNCGKTGKVRRQVTAPAFRLAGSGWYETDFKSSREHKHNLAGGEAGHSSGTAVSSTAGKATGDSKPATAASD